MSSPYSLRLIHEPSGPGPPEPIPSRPQGVPEVEERAGLLINHTLFTAELLGIATEDVSWRIEAIWAVPEEVMRAFDEEDAAVLAALCEQVEPALGAALEPDGTARGELGSRLLASDLVDLDAHGRPYLLSHRMLFADLRRYLAVFRRFLTFAAEHRLWLLIE